MCFGVEFDGIKLRCSIGFPSWSLLDRRIDDILELTYRSGFEIEMMEDEVFQRSEFKRLYDSDCDCSV